MAKASVKYETLKDNLCIGCGVCQVVCPVDAIEMKQCKENYLRPVVDKDKCIDCGKCVKRCPHTFKKLKKEAKKVVDSGNPLTFGTKGADCFVTYVKNGEDRMASASGGIMTYIAKRLLKEGKIDGVLHGRMCCGKTGELHYEACISSTLSDIDKNRSSFYAPLSFDSVLNTVKEGDYNSLLLIGTPCVIRAVKRLFEKDRVLSGKKLYTAALVCSHNVNGRFVDYLSDSQGISRNIPYKINLRKKDGVKDANNYKSAWYAEDGSLIKEVNRFESEFTEQWRNYSFSMNVCNACSDFWGYQADISVKDAWGKWSKDPLGQSIAVLRNRELSYIFEDNDELYTEPLSEEEIIKCQKETLVFKQGYAEKRLTARCAADFNEISPLHKMNSEMRQSSERLYNKMKDGYTTELLRLSQATTKKKERKKLLSRIQRKLFGRFIDKREHYKKGRKKREHQKKILVGGGFGYKNVGDEAQISFVIDRLKNCFPDYNVKVMSPDQEYTRLAHCYTSLCEAPRVAFFRQDESPLYGVSHRIKERGFLRNLNNDRLKLIFLIKSEWIYFNAWLIKHGLPPFLISAAAAGLLYDIKTSALIYFGGGGYLTGKTLSRLWDGILLCRLADLYGVPVAMSGQTIGVWETDFNRRYAKKGFRNVGLITLRDPSASLNALKEIGIEGEHIYPVCDDALFCGREENDDKFCEALTLSGCDDKFISGGYIAFNIHYWGVFKDEDRKKVLSDLKRIADYMLDTTDLSILLIPMAPSDERTIRDFNRLYPSKRIKSLKYDYDFKLMRRVIGESWACVTMKHHPIIFAIGERTPVISLNLSDYYEHKNYGALNILHMEKYSVTMTDSDCYDKFCTLFTDIKENYEDICGEIDNTLYELRKKQHRFDKALKKLIQEK